MAKRVRPRPEFAVQTRLAELLREFDYPDLNTRPPPPIGGDDGGMAHVLIVSSSEPQDVRDKADYVVPQDDSAGPLQTAFDTIAAQQGNNGKWSIWMAGVFDLNTDVTTPSGAWIRGLGYTNTSACT